jgi:hypothetical protein
MRIDPLRSYLNTARHTIGDPLMQDISEGNEHPQVMPSIPQDHLEPSRMERLTLRLKDNDSILDAAVRHMEDAKRAKTDRDNWKAIAILECVRRSIAERKGHPTSVSYTSFELDEAHKLAGGWTLGEPDERGTRMAWRDS